MAPFETLESARQAEPAMPGRAQGEHSSRPIRILLADEPSVFRDGLRAVLNSQPDLHVVAEVEESLRLVEQAAEWHPNVILFEPESSGAAIPVLRAIQEAKLPVRVILLTNSGDSEMLSQAVRHGVSGIVAKKSPTEMLLKSIRRVHAGELWLDRVTTADVVRQLSCKPIPPPRNLSTTEKPATLSRREREIVALVAQGFRNREIADKLFISEQTVKNHMHNIFEKVGVQDRLELALYAIYHRLYE